MDWKFWNKKRREPMEVMLRFLEMLEHQVENGYLALDSEQRLVVMTLDVYNIHLCTGPFTMPVEDKAHAYFKGVRAYMNMLISAYNGENSTQLPLVRDDEPVKLGVVDENHNLVLRGVETDKSFFLVPYNEDDGLEKPIEPDSEPTQNS